MFKKIKFLVILLIIFSFIITAGVVFSAPGESSFIDGGKAAGYKSSSDVFDYAGLILKTVLSVIGFIFFGFVLYAGIRWMTSHGNEELKQKAKDSLANAVIGLSIVVASYAITNFVFDFLGKKEGTVEMDDVACLSDADCYGSDSCVENFCAGGATETPGCCTTAVSGGNKDCETSLESACESSSQTWSQAKCKNEGMVNSENSCHF